MNAGRLLMAGLLAVTGLAGSLAQAQTTPVTLYVDATNGRPGRDGSVEAPYLTINEALAQVVADRGDTVLVRPGDYAERVDLPAGTLLISEAGATRTFIIGTPSVPADLVTLERGGVIRGFSIGETGGAAVRVPVNGSAEITNCVVYASESGIRAEVDADLKCVNNTIYNNLTGLSAGPGATVDPFRNNIIAENTTGIFAGDGATVASAYNGLHNNATNYSGANPGNTDFPSNPLFANAQGLNFHLRDVSNMRDAGDPAATANDRDGTRNDVGADGGPNGALDILAPQIIAQSFPSPAQGQAPLVVLFDARASLDEWGIGSWQWDFDAKDGVSVEGFGASVQVLYNAPGGYLVTLLVTDNSGFESKATYSVRVGNPPNVGISASVKAGPAPLAINFGADVFSGEDLTFAWDFDSDGVTDATGDAPTYTYPAGSAPGIYTVTLTATDGEGVATQVQTPITVTEFAIESSANLSAGAAAVIVVDNEDSPINGAQVTVLPNTVNSPVTIGVSSLTEDDLDLQPQGSVASLINLSPSGIVFSRGIRVEVPLPAAVTDVSGLKVAYYDPGAQAWFTDGLGAVRVLDGTPKRVQFETSHFTTFAITLNSVPEPPKQIFCGGGGTRGNSTGDVAVVALALAALAMSRRGWAKARR